MTEEVMAENGATTHHDGRLHLTVLPGVIGPVSEQPQLAFFGYKPTGEFSVPVSHNKEQIKSIHVHIPSNHPFIIWDELLQM